MEMLVKQKLNMIMRGENLKTKQIHSLEGMWEAEQKQTFRTEKNEEYMSFDERQIEVMIHQHLDE